MGQKSTSTQVMGRMDTRLRSFNFPFLVLLVQSRFELRAEDISILGYKDPTIAFRDKEDTVVDEGRKVSVRGNVIHGSVPYR